MRPRVVILSAFLSPYRSGAEACAEEIAKRLNDDFEMSIVTCRMSRTLPKTDLLHGVPVLRIGTGTKLDPWLFPFLAPFVVRRLKPRIVHAILESFAGLALVICKWVAPEARRILTLQSTNTSLFLRPMHRSAQVITAISSVLIRRAERLGRKGTVLIPNGVLLNDIQEACRMHTKEAGRVLFVGRMEPMKGVDTLLQAFAEVLQIPGMPSHVHLHLVGDGSQRSHFHALAEKLGIHERVEFLGRLTDGRLHREFAEAEIFCGLSRSEALGNVFLEAQAAGCAVLATKTGGIPDIVMNDRTGILVPPDDAKAAASELRRLLTDEALRTRLATAAKDHALRFDWHVIAPRYAEVYQSVLS